MHRFFPFLLFFAFLLFWSAGPARAANVKLSELPTLSGSSVDLAADFLIIVDTSAAADKKVTPAGLFAKLAANSTFTGTTTLATAVISGDARVNSTLTLGQDAVADGILYFEDLAGGSGHTTAISAPAAGSSAFNVIYLPDASGTFALTTNPTSMGIGAPISLAESILGTGVGLTVSTGTTGGYTRGIVLGDIGDNHEDAATNPIQMGVFRDGWSMELIRNLSYDGAKWNIISDVTAHDAGCILELGGEGISLNVIPVANDSSTIGLMGFSVRPDNRRVGATTSYSSGGSWIQHHKTVFARYSNDVTSGTFQGTGTYPLEWLQTDGTAPAQIWWDAAGAVADGNMFEYRKSRGTPETPTAAASADFPMELISEGHDGTTWQKSAKLYTKINAAVSTGVVSQEVRIATSDTDTAGLLDRAVINSTGIILPSNTTAGILRFFEPSGSGTNKTDFKAQAQSADITYILPATIGTTGQVLTTTTSGATGTLSWSTPAGGGDALVANPLSQFAATSSSQFAGVINDETGTGLVPLATDAKTKSTATLGSDDAFTGHTITGLSTGEAVTQWEAVYLKSDGTWMKADANGSGTYPARGIAVATASSAAVDVLTEGVFRDDGGTSWTVGGNIYLSVTAGGLTQTPPATTGDKVQVIGFALGAHTIYVKLSTDYGTAP